MLFRYLLLSLFVVPLAAHAQPVATAFSFGGPGSDIAEGIAADGAGHTYVVGTFEGTLDFGDGVAITSAGDSDAFLVKFDADGVPQWARRAGTDVFNDFGTAVAVAPSSAGDEAGAIYYAGTFTGVATFDGGANPDTTITTFSDFDVFLAQYDAAGDLQWVRRVGGTLQDVANGVAVAPDGEAAGDVFLVGSFTGTAEAGDTTLVSTGSSDAFVARYTAEGDFVWARSAGGTENDTAYDVAVTASGDAFVVGQFSSVALFDEGIALQSVGLADIFVTRYGPDGTAAWATRLGGSGADYARGITLLGQGTLADEGLIAYVAGAFSETILVGSDVLMSAGFSDVLIAALDAEGTPLWGRRAGGPSFDFAEDIQTLPPFAVPVRGDAPHAVPLYVTGYIDGSATFTAPDTTITLSSAGGIDGFLAAYEAGGVFLGGEGGTLIDAFSFGGTNRDEGRGIALLPQGSDNAFNLEPEPIITGTYRGTAALGRIVFESVGSNDSFVARLRSCPSYFCLPTASEDVPAERSVTLSAAPNPFRTSATLTLVLDRPQQKLSVAVFDVLGRRVALLHEGPLAAGAHHLTLDGAALPSGLYVVRAAGDGLQASHRLTLAR